MSSPISVQMHPSPNASGQSARKRDECVWPPVGSRNYGMILMLLTNACQVNVTFSSKNIFCHLEKNTFAEIKL